jgi:hypothetical protein
MANSSCQRQGAQEAVSAEKPPFDPKIEWDSREQHGKTGPTSSSKQESKDEVLR